jgi:cell division protein ZapA
MALRKQHETQEQRLSEGLATLRHKLDAAFEENLVKR